jgi:serine protease Do
MVVVKVLVEDNPDDIRAAMNKPVRDRPSYVDAPDFGLNLAALNDEVRTKMKLPPTQRGVVVTDVDPFSKAAEQRVMSGEVILKVRRDTVGSVREFWARVEQARGERSGSILLLVAGAEGERWVALPVE